MNDLARRPVGIGVAGAGLLAANAYEALVGDSSRGPSPGEPEGLVSRVGDDGRLASGERQPDPDSPFAKLLALKAELEKKGKG